jgi:exodeoxyribonuclease V beta subunit
MTTAPTLLQSLSFPLRGSRLIEASAGTGKTFTIAALYVRLVLGHGGPDAAFARALTPPEILVVTFTEAATGELRDRIRARLVEASASFATDPAQVAARVPGEDLLHDLRADYPPDQWPACARRLRLAADWMDEAAISTIHGWCNRMLREHAFDSDSLFTQALEADHDDLLGEVVRDYWRTYFYPLEEDAAAAVRGWWATPDELFALLRGLLKYAGSDAVPAPAETLRRAQAETLSALAQAKQPWLAWTGQLRALLDEAVARKLVNGRKVQARWYGPWLDGLQAWAQGDQVVPEVADGAWVRLTPAGLSEVWVGSDPCPVHLALEDMTTLRARLAALPDGREDVMRHAIDWVSARFEREQERRAQMGFDDLLTKLRRALTGPNGRRFAELVRVQFPVAMIDEFQDTDATQYAIFDAIYGVAADDDSRALVLIGDPKQAIYAFRGADIHTYLAARRDTAGRHATLDRNFRSTHAMVSAVNYVFDTAEQRADGRGAFLFRSEDDDPLPFFTVGAKGRHEVLQIDGAPAGALTCWWTPEGEKVGAGEYTRRMAEGCAAEVVRLLNLGQQCRAGFAQADGTLRPLAAGDIAILVNKGAEADEVRRALSAGGVRSVYLSDQTSVFGSAVADDLARWLQACAEPADARLLRAALATPTLGLTWAGLDRINHDELHWEERIEQFRGYLRCWQRQGVLPMLRRLLHDFDVPRRLLALGQERTLTDALHLAEMLQVAGELLDGEHALIRHFAEQRGRDDRNPGARQVRLESDAGLVKVVTVHKSKGLEYPLVFLPFAAGFRATKADDVPLRWHDDDGQPRMALKADADVVERVDAERLAEDLRKLYVALTRARFATWLGLAPVADFERSAIGYLVTGGAAVPPADFGTVLTEFAAGCEHVAVSTVPVSDGSRHEPVAGATGAERTLALPQRREAWWIASYSALQMADGGREDGPRNAVSVPAPEDAAQEVFDEARLAHLREGATSPAAGLLTSAGPHAFPRGADAGNFLHGLLEWAGTEGFDKVVADRKSLHDQVARRCNVAGWNEWIVPLQEWLESWLGAPLPLADGTQVRPRDLGRVKVEMEFWFATTNVDTRALDAVVRRHVLPGLARPALAPASLNGMLKGFIDLVFEHEGRYHVADYKSNWLGPNDDAYTAQAMRDAILDHRYDLQYALYLFALHRFLRARLADYDYDTHVGGAAYVFLRGLGALTRGVHTERPPRALVDELDALFTATLSEPA